MYFIDIIGYNRVKQEKIYIKLIKNKITRIIITSCKYFSQLNNYKHCSATAHLPPSSVASLQSWGHVGNVSWITLECIFSSRFIHKLFLFCAPGKKKGIFLSPERTMLTKMKLLLFFVLFEVIVQPCWHASLVQELILLSIRLLEQSTCIFLYEEKQGVYLMKEILYFFFDKEGAIAFFSYQRLLGAYSAVIQKVSREQLLQVFGSYFDDNWEATGTGRS